MADEIEKIIAEVNGPPHKGGNPNIAEAGKQTRWMPGQSGQPRGRPPDPALRQVRDLAREHTQEAMAALVRVMRNKKSSPNAVVAAACAILDRGWGKPQQQVDIAGAKGGIVIMLPPLDGEPATTIEIPAPPTPAALSEPAPALPEGEPRG